jgi:hypothetical protein
VKLNVVDQASSIVKVKRDLFYLQSLYSSDWTAPRLFEAFGDSVCDVRSLALSTKHPDFAQLLLSLYQYVNLELVLIVVAKSPWNTVQENKLPPEQWTSTPSGPENRISRPGEVMFEILHPDNSWVRDFAVLDKRYIPGSKPLPSSLMQLKNFDDPNSPRVAPFKNWDT